nr:Gag-Pol polyprotein [Tanacetum cinerariifolium]
MFDIDYLTDSLNYSRVSSTNLTVGSQSATPSNAGSQEADSNSDDEPDVFIIHSTPTLVVPIVDEATTQNDGTKSDHATTHADSLDELAELQALQRQEQAGKEKADRLGLAFPRLNLILGVGTASIGSPVSAGSTPSMSSCFLSQVEQTTVAQALADPDWVEAMQAEMQQFRNQKVWVLVTLPDGKQAIGT